MEPDGSLPCSQASSAVPVLSQMNSIYHLILPNIHRNIMTCVSA
jgi:hypothetical protein